MKIRLRHERLAEHLARSQRTQNAWALILGLDKGHLSRLVNGKRPYPGPGTRQRLLRGLGLTFEDLFEVEVGPPDADLVCSKGRGNNLWRLLSRQRRLIRGDGLVKVLLQDIRYSLRLFANNPLLTGVALATLALGIGSNTAIFSLIHATLIEPIPYPEADRIVFMGTQHPLGKERGAVSFPDFLSWQENSKVFSQMAAVNHESVTFQGDDGALRVLAETVTADYFEVLGIAPERGRPFLRSEAEEPGADNRVVILSHGFWQDVLGGREPVLGSHLELSGAFFEVIGVMPPGFHGVFETAQIWLPLADFDQLHPELAQYRILQTRSTRFLTGLGRLREGISVALARERMGQLAESLAAQFPGTNQGRGIILDEAREELVGGFRRPLFLLLAAVAAILLIASTNLANLYLARAAGRGREMAIRTAMGASRGRLVRQVLTETITLSLLGGLLGVLLAGAGLRLSLAFLPYTLPKFVDVQISWPILLFALVLSLLTGILFGSIPALRSVGDDLAGTLKRDERQAWKTSSRRWFSGGLVVIEVALSLALLLATGLILKSFYKLSVFDPGFESDHLFSASFSLPEQKYEGPAQGQLLEEILGRVQELPGVEDAALTSHVFFGGGYMTGDFYVEGREPESAEGRLISYRQCVSPGFFQTLEVPLLRGREFRDGDRASAPQVAIVNRQFAESFWPGEDPLGKRISFGDPSLHDEVTWRTVVGVVGNVQPAFRSRGVLWQIYVPVQQGGEWSRYLMIRASSSTADLAQSLRVLMGDIDPDIALFDWHRMSDHLEDSSASTRFLAVLLALFGCLGLFLSGVGIYGVMSHTVTRARPEIGIRLALGATRRDILTDFLRYGSVRAVVGMLAGGVVFWWTASLLSSQLYGVSSLDGQVIATALLFLGTVALLSCLIPSWRAARQDPMETIRT